MKLQKKTVADVEDILDYLMGVCGMASNGDREELEQGAFDYAKTVLQAAESSMQKLGMYEITKYTFEEAQQLTLMGEYEQADDLLLTTAREMREKSGTNKKLRQLYSKASNS